MRHSVSGHSVIQAFSNQAFGNQAFSYQAFVNQAFSYPTSIRNTQLLKVRPYGKRESQCSVATSIIGDHAEHGSWGCGRKTLSPSRGHEMRFFNGNILLENQKREKLVKSKQKMQTVFKINFPDVQPFSLQVYDNFHYFVNSRS